MRIGKRVALFLFLLWFLVVHLAAGEWCIHVFYGCWDCGGSYTCWGCGPSYGTVFTDDTSNFCVLYLRDCLYCYGCTGYPELCQLTRIEVVYRCTAVGEEEYKNAEIYVCCDYSCTG
jgi:hypothetical protein